MRYSPDAHPRFEGGGDGPWEEHERETNEIEEGDGDKDLWDVA